MKLLPYPQLPFFNEMMTVLRKNHITSWQANDFWKKIRQDFDVEKTNINYQNVYRFVLRLERENFLIIDSNKNEMGCTTYSETINMKEFRDKFCSENDASLLKLTKYLHKLKDNLEYLNNEIEAIHELKNDLPEFFIEFENLQIKKNAEICKLKYQLNILRQFKK